MASVTVDPTNGYSPHGGVRKATLPNGLTEAIMYNKSLQPCRVEINSTAAGFTSCADAAPSGNVLDFTYGYNAGTSNNGNVASWSAVGTQTFTRSYGYDSVNRLSAMSDTAASQACKGVSWTIDAWANLTDQTQTSGSCLALHVTVGTNNRLGSPYQYDSAGNMTSDGTHTYFYDAEGRVTKVDNGSTATYVYDAEGNRVLNTNTSAGTNSYIYGIDGRVIADVSATGNWNTGYVYAGGSLVAQYRDSTTYSIFGDHLGSARLITKLDKSVYDSLDFMPFGAQIAGASGTAYKFTGDARDSESNLDHTSFRKYSSNLNRWTSPDPGDLSTASISVPQSWNRYAYVLNNPLALTDPLGLDPCQGANDYDFSQAADGTGIFTPEECMLNGGTWDGSGFGFLGPGGGSGGGGGTGNGGPSILDPTPGCVWQTDENGVITIKCDDHSSGGGNMAVQKSGAANSWSKLTPAQCKAAQTVLDREAKFGTTIAAWKSAIGHGDGTIGAFNSTNTAPINTPVGSIKLDWYTDLQLPSPLINTTPAGTAAYPVAKLIWTGIRLSTGQPIRNPLPFMNWAEVNAWVQSQNPLSTYRSILTPEFMAQACGGKQ